MYDKLVIISPFLFPHKKKREGEKVIELLNPVLNNFKHLMLTLTIFYVISIEEVEITKFVGIKVIK